MTEERKLKVVFLSDFALKKTGYGRFLKSLLTYLYQTDKYELINVCKGIRNDPAFNRTPWKTIGVIPNDPNVINHLNAQPAHVLTKAHYGEFHIDELIKELRPDVFIGIEDIWGLDFCIDKEWFKKITSVIHTTLDSLPIHPAAINKAPRCKNFWVWSEFAEEALHEAGAENVKTVHGCIETDKFFPLNSEARADLRNHLGIPQDEYIVGFVGRNQLRKLFPNLIKGFRVFKENYGIKKTKLLLHTDVVKGYWNIPKLAADNGVELEDIYFTYYCSRCKNFEIKPFKEISVCRFCGNDKQGVANPNEGVNEDQMRLVYNLMDVYVHPITSGGQEVPVQEAKLCGLITLVNDYSCGADMCVPEAHSITLAWSENWEGGTNFIKASPHATSIANGLHKVYQMSPEKRFERGMKGREWCLANYSVESVGKIFEEFLDKCPFIDEEVDFTEPPKNPNAKINGDLEDREWLKELYDKILNMFPSDDDEGFQQWIAKLEIGTNREYVENYFRQEAIKLMPKSTSTLDDLLDDGKRIAFVMPKSIGDVFMCTSLLRGIKETYPEHDIYFFTEPRNFDVLQNNKYIHKLLPYHPQCDSIFYLEGQAGHKGWFDYAFLPYGGTQRFIDYTHKDDVLNIIKS